MTIAFSTGLFGAAMLAATAFPALAEATRGDPLAAYRGRSRVLVAVASEASDPKLSRQRDIFAAMKAGAKERDLVLVDASGASQQAAALRKTFVLGDGFHAVLVGKDGGGKLTSTDPLGPAQLFPLIDAMPMRQEEMKRR